MFFSTRSTKKLLGAKFEFENGSDFEFKGVETELTEED